MPSEFPIIEVRLTGDDNVTEPTFVGSGIEQMGSKAKFWCEELKTNRKFLLKFARPATGEDWAEKIASELAGGLLGLPHAAVDLANYKGLPGVLSEFFPRPDERLIHGNELLLLELDANYPSREIRRVRQHTLENVLAVLVDIELPVAQALPPEVRSAGDLFCGYLVLDALIGNTDRHHENWGIIISRTPGGRRVLSLAPTYDHGSSLGRELPDSTRERKLKGADKRADLASYASNARSALYRHDNADRPLRLIEALSLANQTHQPAIQAWISRATTSSALRTFEALIDRVPAGRMSSVAKQFALRLLEYNRAQLQGLERST